ncbi:MAG: hypothetical protein V4797_36415 [Paraburkholderia tropica]|uniref:hypothetical protein n=1 Tax=Paraburkholderia tropica TaxID=92647 RepID=UPI0031015F7A
MEQAVERRPFRIARRVAAVAATVVAVVIAMQLASNFSDRHQLAAGSCQPGSVDSQRQVLVNYFKSSADQDKTFELLPGAIWDEHSQIWTILLRHTDNDGVRATYVARITCDGHADLSVLSGES